MATVLLTVEAQKQIDKLPMTIQARMWRIVRRLENWPDVSGAKPLSGELAGCYRIRTGDYRLQFSIETERVEIEDTKEEKAEYVVLIEKVGHRDGFYGD